MEENEMDYPIMEEREEEDADWKERTDVQYNKFDDDIVLPNHLLVNYDGLCGWTGSVQALKDTIGNEMDYPINEGKIKKILKILDWNETHGTHAIVLSRRFTDEGLKRWSRPFHQKRQIAKTRENEVIEEIKQYKELMKDPRYEE